MANGGQLAKIIRVAPYSRVSTDKDDQANSLESQRMYYSEYINRQTGWILAGEYYDEGLSGTSTKKRDGFKRMIQDAFGGKIDLIITKEVSRFARNTVDTLQYTRELKKHGVGVLFMNDNIDSRDPDAEFRLGIMAGMAQEESRKTSSRVGWGQRRCMEKGVVFGRSMLGYDIKDGKMTVNPEGAELVRKIFHMYLDDSLGAFTIARRLEDAGIRTFTGRTNWTAKVIYAMLRNEKYVGDLCQQKTYTPDYLTHKKKYNHGAKPKIYIRDHHEPIISRELWNAAQAEIQRRSSLLTQEQRSKHSNLYWCSGKVQCAACGSHYMRRIRRLPDGQERRAWICREAVMYGSRRRNADGSLIGCDSNSVNERVLKYCLRYAIRQFSFRREQLVDKILDEIQIVQQQENPYDLKKLQKEIDKQEAKKCRAIQLRLDGEISPSELQTIKEEIDKRTLEIQEFIKTAIHFENHQIGCITDCTQRIQEILDDEDTMTDQNVVFLGKMLDRIVVYPQNQLEVRLIGVPFGLRLSYFTRGKSDTYKVVVNHQERIW